TLGAILDYPFWLDASSAALKGTAYPPTSRMWRRDLPILVARRASLASSSPTWPSTSTRWSQTAGSLGECQLWITAVSKSAALILAASALRDMGAVASTTISVRSRPVGSTEMGATASASRGDPRTVSPEPKGNRATTRGRLASWPSSMGHQGWASLEPGRGSTPTEAAPLASWPSTCWAESWALAGVRLPKWSRARSQYPAAPSGR